ncbi:MAG: hypothetical protein RIC87_23390 [Kiloniellales bacterium]
MKNNRAALESKGCVFPSFLGPDNHTRLAAYAMDVDAIAPVKIDLRLTEPAQIEAFRTEIDKQFKEHIQPGKKYVLSNEHCSAHLHTGPEITRLHKLLTSTGHSVKVIIYFREPSEYLASSYSTLLKMGATHEMKCPVGRALDRKYNYFAICKRWARVFGKDNIIARVYARDALAGRDIRKDFLQLIDVSEEGLDFSDLGGAGPNRSLDHVMAGFLREVNKQVPRYVDNKVNPLRADLGPICEQLSNKEGILVPKAISNTLRESLLDDLKEFNRRYLGGQLKWPFKPYKQVGRKLVRAPNRDEVLELYGQVWQAKMAQLRGDTIQAKQASEPSPSSEASQPVPVKQGGQTAAAKQGGQPVPVKQGGQSAAVKQGGQSGPANQGGQTAAAKQGGQSGPAKQGGQSGPAKQGGQSAPARQGGQPGPAKQGGQSAPARQGGQSGPAKQVGQSAPSKQGG